jgi:hypothetical protein
LNTAPVSFKENYELFCIAKRPEIGYGGVMKTKEQVAQKKRDWYLAHREESIARTKAWRKVNPDGRRKHRRTARGVFDATSETKISPCELCLRIMKLQQDHNHSSGKKRGWLCSRCNLLLGWWEIALQGNTIALLEAYCAKYA